MADSNKESQGKKQNKNKKPTKGGREKERNEEIIKHRNNKKERQR